MNAHFLEQIAKPLRNEYLQKTNAEFFIKLQELSNEYAAVIRNLCERKDLDQSKISYVEFALLRTYLWKQKYFAPLVVYEKDWYLSPKHKKVGEINLEAVFQYYDELRQKLKQNQKLFRNTVSEEDVEGYLFSLAGDFWDYIHIACQKAVMQVDLNGFFSESCIFRSCEYFSLGNFLWKNTVPLPEEKLLEWFSQKREEEYHYRTFEGYCFENQDFSKIEWNHCKFVNCSFDGTNLQGADLFDSWFQNCSMIGTNLKVTWLSGCEFIETNLKDALFEGAYSTTKIGREEWVRPDIPPVCFKKCDLNGADLTETKLEDVVYL